WKAIQQAVTRKGPQGVLNAGERLDRQTMFYAYTRNAARTIGLKRSNSLGLTSCRWVIEWAMPLSRSRRACCMPFSASRTARS
ncbi:hypothetical protein KGZ13_34010, partial [Pseudomonas aeruginosa]